MRPRKARIHFDGFLKLSNSLFVLSANEVNHTDDPVNNERKRVFGLLTLYLVNCFVVSTHYEQVFGIPMMGRGVTGFELDGPFELFFSFSKIPLVFKQNGSERGMRLRE